MRPYGTQCRLLGVAAATVLHLVSAVATAQQPGVALDRLDPAPAGDRMFGVQSPYAAGSALPHAMLMLDYAHNPLVLRREASGASLGNIVSGQLYMHLNGGIALWNRLNVNVDVPVALYQSGGNPTGDGQSFASPTKAQFGDLRLDLRVRIWGDYYDAFQIGFGGYIWFPTAAKGAFVGDGQVRGLPQIIVGGRTDRLVYSAAIGPDIRKNEAVAGVDLGAMFKWGAGIGVLLLDNRHLQLGAETSWAVTPRDVSKLTTNAELLADARYRIIDDVEIGLGLGPGLSGGVGTPDFRGVFMVAYSPEPKRDRDGDGIPDAEDACPDEKGVHSDDPKKNGCPAPADRDGDGIADVDDACPDVKGVHNDDPKKNGCPPEKPDTDGDGIPDDEDACPDVKGVRTEDPKTNGCPADRDGDGIPDAVDACPDVKGVANPDPKKNGCPPDVDTDGDGIMDSEDACPNEKGVRTDDPKTNGCPRSVRVTESEILILEQVQFDTGQATIKKVSDRLLDEVAAVLKEHAEIARIEVQGHTDNRGAPTLNKGLSQARADAVMKALVKRGVGKERLSAMGYGQDKPIAPNTTDEGRQQNRRVQFAILQKKPKPPPR